MFGLAEAFAIVEQERYMALAGSNIIVGVSYFLREKLTN